MDLDRTYRAGEAAQITGVIVNLQHNWRNRGILPGPSGNRAKASFSLRDLCQLRLIRAFSDRGCDLKQAATLADPIEAPFTAVLAEATFGKLRHQSQEPAVWAVVAFSDAAPRLLVARDFSSVDAQLGDGAPTSLLAINLGPIASEMAEKIDLVDVDRRIEVIDEEMQARGL